MEKDYSLQCIDHAVQKTIEKSNIDRGLKKLNSCSHFTTAIIEYMFKGNAKGFSSNGDGRTYILGLSKEDFEEQLLKHVVKSNRAKERLHIKKIMRTNKSFDEELDADDVQAIVYRSLQEMDMSEIKCILDKYPSLYTTLADNFISERYYNYNLGCEELDKHIDTYRDSFYYNKIDSYYKNLKKATSIQK